MSINRIIILPDDYPDPGTYFAFDDMIGGFQPMQQTTELLERRGHRAESVRLAGIRAPDSKITTIRYFATRDDAILALASYVDLLDGNPYQVIQHGALWGTFLILSPILQGPIHPVGASSGTLVANPTCMQVLHWTMRNTDPPEP